jgi:pimeloyl-ACP methyl ester carboxylesterase
MRFRRKHVIVLILVLLLGGFALGPRPDYPEYTPEIVPGTLAIHEVEAVIQNAEAAQKDLKPGNQAFIRWAGEPAVATEYCLLFVHGFSASPVAGTPVATEFADRYGMNYYAPRLKGHGLASEESFADLSPAEMINSVKEALAISRVLGRKTIVIASSTGCTLAAYLAAYNPEYVESMLLFSPNIDLADKTSALLLMPWGLQLARMVVGRYREVESLIGTPSEPFWTTKYRVEGLLALKYLIRETMQEEVFTKIRQPLYLGYYFQDEENCDKTVSIPAMKDFFEQISTPEEQKRIEAIGEGAHVMLSDIQCPDVESVKKRAFSFAEEVLGLAPVPEEKKMKIDSLLLADPPLGQ